MFEQSCDTSISAVSFGNGKFSQKGMEFKLRQHIPAKHKFTITELKTGDAVVMYGVMVGKAMQNIPKAELISIHNLTNAIEAYSTEIKNYHWTVKMAGTFSRTTPPLLNGISPVTSSWE